MNLRTTATAILLIILLLVAGCRTGPEVEPSPGEQRTPADSEQALPGQEVYEFPPGRGPSLFGLSDSGMGWLSQPRRELAELTRIEFGPNGGITTSTTRLEQQVSRPSLLGGAPYAQSGYSDQPVPLQRRSSAAESQAVHLQPQQGFEAEPWVPSELLFPADSMSSSLFYSSSGDYLFSLAIEPGELVTRNQTPEGVDEPSVLHYRIAATSERGGGGEFTDITEGEVELPLSFGMGQMAAASAAEDSLLLAFNAGVNPGDQRTRLARIDSEGELLTAEQELEGNPSSVMTGPDGHSALLLTTQVPSGEDAQEQQPRTRLWEWREGEGFESLHTFTGVTSVNTVHSRDLERVFVSTVSSGLFQFVREDEGYRTEHYPQIITNQPIVWLPRFGTLALLLGRTLTVFRPDDLREYNDFLSSRAETRMEQLRSSLEDTDYSLPEGRNPRLIEHRSPSGFDTDELYLFPADEVTDTPDYLFKFRRGEQHFNFYQRYSPDDPAVIDVTAVADDAEATTERAREATGQLLHLLGEESVDGFRKVLDRSLGEVDKQQQISLCSFYRVQHYRVCKNEISFYFITPEMGLKTMHIYRHPKPENPQVWLSKLEAEWRMKDYGKQLSPLAQNVVVTQQYLVGHYPSFDPELLVPTKPNTDMPNVSWKFRISNLSGEFYINARTGQLN